MLHNETDGTFHSGKTMTDEMAKAWSAMRIEEKHQIQRLKDWANMLEARVKEFDPDYRGYQWGRKS